MAQKLLLFIQNLINYDQKNFVTNSKMKTSKQAVSQCLRIANRGFTIVEIITVVAIFSTLALIGYPTFTKWVPNYELKGATRTLQGDFQRAKLHAVKNNRDVTFNFTVNAACTGGPSGYAFSEMNKDGTVNAVIISKTFDGTSSCIQNSTFATAAPWSGFNSRGLPDGITGTVKLKHARIPREYIITQTLGGSIRIN